MDVNESLFLGRPQWHTYKGLGGTSHIFIQRDGHEAPTTLCGYSNEPSDSPSLTAPHCKSCTSRLKRFVNEALVEHEWVRETVTVTVVRPAPSPSVESKVASMLRRHSSWQHTEIDVRTEPYGAPDPDESE